MTETRRMHKRLLTLYIPALLLFVFIGGAAAQVPGGGSSSEGTCPTTVNAALQSLDELCTGLGRNQACYGVNRVVTTFFDEVQEETFNAPGAITPIDIIETIRTAPLNPETQEWGVAVMSVQANLPNTLPGQGALFVLIGDVSIENEVNPATATSLPDPAPATLIADQEKINLRSGPGTTFSVIVAATVGDAVGVDAIDETGQWYRV
ncbi:MAG: SH3 domain-containing protein, partial [Chloroflexota bacterium]